MRWPVLFMPYIGGSSNVAENYYEINVHDCPSYPLKEQTVDYCTNAFNLQGTLREYFGFTKVDDFPRHATTIYMADYEYTRNRGHIKWINCLFIDGHSSKMAPLDITVHDYGLPAGMTQ